MRKRSVLGIKRHNLGPLNMVCPAGCLDNIGGQYLDAAALEPFYGIRSVRWPIARVNKRHDPDSGIQQLTGKSPACVVMTDHHRSGTGLHAIQVQQASDPAAEHDAGEIVVLKNGGIFVAPGGNNHTLCTQMNQPLGLHHAQQPAFIAAKGSRGRQNINVWLGGDLLSQ